MFREILTLELDDFLTIRMRTKISKKEIGYGQLTLKYKGLKGIKRNRQNHISVMTSWFDRK